MKDINIFKKLKIVTVLLGISISLTACDATLDDVRTYTDNLDNVMQEVIDRNVSIISELYNSGLLNDQQREVWERSIREKCAALMNTADEQAMINAGVDPDVAKNKSKAVFEQFKKAMVYTAQTTKKLPRNGGDDPNYPSYNKIAGQITQYQDSAKPLILFDDASVTTFLNDLNRPVYVLDTTRRTNGVEDTTDLKYLQLALAILKNDADTLNNIMSAERLTDSVTIASVGTIGELKQNMTNLTAAQQSSLERYVLSFFKKTDYNLASLEVDDVFTDTVDNPSCTIGEPAPANKINYDVVVSSNGLAVLTLRIHELNKNLVPFLQGFASGRSGEQGLAGNYYLMKSDKIALKLDYKLEAISDIYTGSVASHGAVTDTNWECKTEPTEYTISIYDGTMSTEDGTKNKFTDNLFTSRSVMVHPKNTVKQKIGFVQRYTTGKANNAADEVKSDEIDFDKESTEEVEGDVTYTCFYKRDGTKVYAHYNYADCPTVVLKDYLETNYFPNVIDDEMFITVGRQMRVNKLSGTAENIDKFAEAITKGGSSFENPVYISLRDIVDHQSGQGYYEGINEKLGLGQDNTVSVNEELAKSLDDRQSKLKSIINPGMLDGDGDVDTTQEGTTEEDQVTKKLQYDVYFNWIRPVQLFGEKEDVDAGIQNLNLNDAQGVADHTIPTMWCMFTSNSISENLWGSWITASADREEGSLAWFDGWLANNKYTYHLTKEMLLSQDKADSATFKKDGSISFDLRVVDQVQKIQNEKYGFNLERTLRTASRIIGMLIMLYGIVMLGAWVIDINIEGGPGFLKLMTAGKWRSIRDSTGIPAMPPDGVHYIDFKSLCFSVFLVLCLGVVLMILDVIDIRDIVTGYTDNIFKAIRDILFS